MRTLHIQLLLIMCFMLNSVFAQKYYTKTGITEFKASKETFEPIEAKNESTTVVLNTENGHIASLLFVKAFHFEVALMEEHFHENYMESDKFPKGTFKGNIVDFDSSSLSEKPKEFQLKGTLNIRGKDKIIATPVALKKVGERLFLDAEFIVSPQDFDVKIPSIVKEKIANDIKIMLHYELDKK